MTQNSDDASVARSEPPVPVDQILSGTPEIKHPRRRHSLGSPMAVKPRSDGNPAVVAEHTTPKLKPSDGQYTTVPNAPTTNIIRDISVHREITHPVASLREPQSPSHHKHKIQGYCLDTATPKQIVVTVISPEQHTEVDQPISPMKYKTVLSATTPAVRRESMRREERSAAEEERLANMRKRLREKRLGEKKQQLEEEYMKGGIAFEAANTAPRRDEEDVEFILKAQYRGMSVTLYLGKREILIRHDETGHFSALLYSGEDVH